VHHHRESARVCILLDITVYWKLLEIIRDYYLLQCGVAVLHSLHCSIPESQSLGLEHSSVFSKDGEERL